MATPNVSLGPPTIVPIPFNPVLYYANDSRFPYLPNSNGTANITFWVDGVNFRSEGPSLDSMSPINPTNSVLSATPGTFDNGGVWLQMAVRRGGILYGFYHAEDHSCTPYTEWNSTGLAVSMDDGLTWVKQGQVIGSPNYCTNWGGITANSIAWDELHSRWIGWGGNLGFVSTNAAAAPGTWYGYNNGNFSTPLPGSGTLTALPGLSGNISVQSVVWNSYLNQWVMVYQTWGDGTGIFYTTSSDGITWASETVLMTGATNESLGYVQIIGDTGESCGQDALLVYERFPSVESGRSRDMIERWIHWGSLTVPTAPTNLSANGRWSCQTQVLLKWNAATQAQSYNIFRANSSGGPYVKIGEITTSASFPSYVDTTAIADITYYYEVQTTNNVGTSDYSSSISALSSGPATGNVISINFVGGTTSATNILMDCSEVAGMIAAPNWNNAVGAGGALPDLEYNGGAASGVSLNWSSPNTWSTGLADAAGNNRMMKGYLDGANPSITISNIPPAFTNSGYDVYVYCDGDAYSGRTGKYTIGSTNIQAVDSSTFGGTFIQASNSVGNFVLFSNLKTSRFDLYCQGVGGGDGTLRAPVNGIQIVASTPMLPPVLGWQMSPDGADLILTWPFQYLGWWLQSQTVFQNSGLGTNWVSVPGSSLTNQIFQAVGYSNAAMFYRLLAP